MNPSNKTIIALAFCLISSFTFAQSTVNPVQIIGSGIHYGGKIIYSYQIKNNGTETISRVLLGFSDENPNFPDTLKIFPYSTAISTIADWFPSNVVTRPDGWGAKLVAAADGSGQMGIEWIEGKYFANVWPNAAARPNAPAVYPTGKGILPGQSLNGFSVNVGSVDYSYLKTTALVTYGDNVLSVQIEKADLTPPVIDLTVSRTNQNGANGNWAIFDVRASVLDNLDASPEFKFEPITANQSLDSGSVSIDAKGGSWKIKLKNVAGRIYQMRFVATDASGNQSVRTYTYDVNSAQK